MIKGKQSLSFTQAPYLLSTACVGGSKEAKGPLGKYFDLLNTDDLFGEDTWEAAESTMQKEACVIALGKAHVEINDVRYLFGGDLLRQGIATSMGVEALQIPMFGLYGACSTSGEALALASMAVAAGYGSYILAVTSSHFGSAEKEFRFPLGYANQRPLSAQWTVTGSGAFVVSSEKYYRNVNNIKSTKNIGNVNSIRSTKNTENVDKSGNVTEESGKAINAGADEKKDAAKKSTHVRIAGVTIGKIVDYGLKDSQNMGGCMAPAAADTIQCNLEDFHRKPSDYDRIITGDLGYIGTTILEDMMKRRGYDITEQHLDCGMMIYNQDTQDTHAGGSGCGCAASTLSGYVLPKIQKGEWKRVLFVPTGALMSTVSFNEGESVPGIAHAIILEHF